MENLEYLTKNLNVKVFIRCFTYNQKNYIQDALNGFAIQKTNFPYMALVMDDCSTDGEQDSIRNWIVQECNMDKAQKIDIESSIIIIVPHKLNSYCTFVFFFLKRNLNHIWSLKQDLIFPWMKRSKYLAFCEGDDYWTNPNKLQIQVDYMDQHPDCGLCYTDFDIFTENDGKTNESVLTNNKLKRPQSFEDHLLNRYYLGPMTWMYSNEKYQQLNYCGEHSDGTYALAMEFFVHSTVAYLPINTATYRVHDDSACHQIDTNKNFLYKKGVFDTQLMYAQRYCNETMVEQLTINAYLTLLPYAFKANDTDFINYAILECQKRNIDLMPFFNLLQDYKAIRQSPSYKIGNSIISPLKKILKK